MVDRLPSPHTSVFCSNPLPDSLLAPSTSFSPLLAVSSGFTSLTVWRECLSYLPISDIREGRLTGTLPLKTDFALSEKLWPPCAPVESPVTVSGIVLSVEAILIKLECSCAVVEVSAISAWSNMKVEDERPKQASYNTRVRHSGYDVKDGRSQITMFTGAKRCLEWGSMRT